MQNEMAEKDENSRSEKCLTILVCAIFSFHVIMVAIVSLLRQIIVLPYKLDTILFYSLLFGIVMYASPLISKRIKGYDLAFLGVFIICWLISILLSADYLDYFMTIGSQFMVSAVPCYVICRCVRNYELMRRYLGIAAVLITLSLFVELFVLNMGLSEDYSQYQSYQILPAAIISISELLRAKKPIHLVNLIAAFFLMLATGARGPLVCMILFIGLIVVIAMGKSAKNIVLTIGVSIGSLFAIRLYFYDILNYLRAVMVQYSLSVRTVDRLISNEFFQDSSRAIIAGNAWHTIMEHPLLGVGLGRDRIIIAKLIGVPASEAIGWYPHNIGLELLMQLGLIWGSICLIAIIAIIIRAIWRSKNNIQQDVLCIFIAIGIFPLLFSGSYFTSGLFFAAIAMCLNMWQWSKKQHTVAKSI